MKSLFARLGLASRVLALAAVLGSLLISIQPVLAQGTAFTYQDQIQNNGSPASGTFNLTFSLFNTNANGAAIAGPVTLFRAGLLQHSSIQSGLCGALANGCSLTYLL